MSERINITNTKYQSSSGESKPNMPVEDTVLWKKFKKGDESAFITIYSFYFSKLMTFGYQLVKDKELVKDCIQDLFIYLRDSRSKLSDTTSIKLYLYKSLRRRIIHELGKIAREKEQLNIDDRSFNVELSTETRMINSNIQSNNFKNLSKAIANLSPKQREAIYYFYFENMSYLEITSLMGYKQVKTTRTLVYEALAKLKVLLKSTFLLLLALVDFTMFRSF